MPAGAGIGAAQGVLWISYVRIALTTNVRLRASVRGSSAIQWIIVGAAVATTAASLGPEMQPWLKDAAERVGLRLSAGTAGDTRSGAGAGALEPEQRADFLGLRPTLSATVIPAGLRVIEPPDFPTASDSPLPFGVTTDDWYSYMTTLTTEEEVNRFAEGAIYALRDQVEVQLRELDAGFDRWKEALWAGVADRRRALAERYGEDSPQFRDLDAELGAWADMEILKGAVRYEEHRQTMAAYAEQVRLAIDQATRTRLFELTQEPPSSGAIAF